MNAALQTMIDDIKAERDTTETCLGRPLIRYAHFAEDFKDLVRRLIDPSKTTTSNSDGSKGTGHLPRRVRNDVGEWEETGWEKTRERVVMSVSGQIKGIKTHYSKTLHGWSHERTGEWIPKAEWDKKMWTEREWKRKVWREWNYDPKLTTRTVMDYLPDIVELRTLLFNLFSAPRTDDHYADFGLDSMVDPFQQNAY